MSPIPPPSPRRGDPEDAPDVLVVVNDLAPYGSQRVAVALIEEWALTRWVAVATLEAPAESDLPLPPGVARHVLRRPGSKARALVSLAWQLRRLVARERPRHVLAHMTFANTITLLALVGTRVRPVVVEHSLLSRALPEQAGGRVSAVLLRRLHPVASVVVAPSNAVVADVRAMLGVPLERLRRIYNPVPHRTSDAPAPHVWLEPSRSVTTFLCVGSFRPAKGQSILVEVLRLLRERGAGDVRVIFLGGEGGLPAVVAQTQDVGVGDMTFFAGYQDDVSAWLRRADALVMPSRWETFGLVAVEAARCGVPVVATDVPGLNEIVPERVPGWVVPPEDPSALADLLAGLRRPLPMPSEPVGLEDFEPAEVAARYWSLLEEVSGR